MIDQAPAVDKLNTNQISIQPVTEQCVVETAKRFDLPDILLKAMLAVEAGKIGELRVNLNGSYDIGPMQVNSSWLPQFKNYISKDDILYNGCKNIQVGAWILRYNIDQAGGDYWTGIGNYHSKNKEKHEKYRKKIYTAIQAIKADNKNNTKLT